MSLRNELRAKIFDAKNRKPESRIITLFSVEVEVRQPLLQDIMDLQDADMKNEVTPMLINFVFVPGTDENVFEEADKESLNTMPFGPDLALFTTTIQELTDIDLKDAEKN